MDAIKPKDFLEQIPKPEGIKDTWWRKRKQKGKDIIPKQAGSCSSCLFCVQGGSIFQCNNLKSKNYGYQMTPDSGCRFYIQDSY